MIEYYNHLTNNDKWIVDIYKGKRNGYFVEAGALDGISGSCTYTLEKYFDWKGILVEPGIPFKNLIKNRRKSVCENLCIFNKNGFRCLTQLFGSFQSIKRIYLPCVFYSV